MSFKIIQAFVGAMLAVSSVCLFAASEDGLTVSSVGRNSKLVLKSDLLIPANQQGVLLKEASRGDGYVVSYCRVEMNEVSLDHRVLKSGGEIIFSGQFSESVEVNYQNHTLQVTQPAAISAITCGAMRMDRNYKWHPTTPIIWDLKASFAGVADLVLAGPVEIPNP